MIEYENNFLPVSVKWSINGEWSYQVDGVGIIPVCPRVREIKRPAWDRRASAFVAADKLTADKFNADWRRRPSIGIGVATVQIHDDLAAAFHASPHVAEPVDE